MTDGTKLAQYMEATCELLRANAQIKMGKLAPPKWA